MTAGLYIWEMYAATLLIILEDLTKYYNNMPESAILATYVTTPIHMMRDASWAKYPDHTPKPIIKSRKPQLNHIPGLGHKPV
mgnify:CR=1 FL=1